MWREFKAFLIKQNAVALAIAVVIGVALNKVVTSIVDDFIMPIVSATTPSGAWQKATFAIGPVNFGIGNFLSAVLNFLIIGFVVWRISKIFVPPDAPPAKATKTCPFCFADIDVRASKCPQCTSAV